MTDVAVPESTPDLPALAPGAAVPSPTAAASPLPESDALVVWAAKAQLAYAIAGRLANTSFVPASMRGKPGDVTGALLAAEELGMPPMAALRSIDVIQGTPGLRAHAMRALVLSHGHAVEMLESSDMYCRMRGRRRGTRNWQTVEWTIERAAKMGLTGKGEWKRQPKTMLQARATGEICRLIAADVLHAMPYAAEELDGYSSQRTTIVNTPTARDTTAEAEPVTLAELAAASSVTSSADGESLGQAVTDTPDIDAYDAPSDDDAYVEDWPEAVQPGTGGAR